MVPAFLTLDHAFSITPNESEGFGFQKRKLPKSATSWFLRKDGSRRILTENDCSAREVARQPQNNLIRGLRRSLGLQQRELAYLLGYRSTTRLSRLENGRITPSLEELIALELLSGVRVRSLFPQHANQQSALLVQRIEAMHGRLEWLLAPRRQSDKAAQLEVIMTQLKREMVQTTLGSAASENFQTN